MWKSDSIYMLISIVLMSQSVFIFRAAAVFRTWRRVATLSLKFSTKSHWSLRFPSHDFTLALRIRTKDSKRFFWPGSLNRFLSTAIVFASMHSVTLNLVGLSNYDYDKKFRVIFEVHNEKRNKTVDSGRLGDSQLKLWRCINRFSG